MRKLFILRGVPGAKKSSWVAENDYSDLAISSDDIRLTLSARIFDVDGTTTISQRENAKTWELLFDILEWRMSNGETTIVDATNIERETLKKYKSLADNYYYEMYIVNFPITKAEAKKINKSRAEYKRVGPEVIDKFFHKQSKFKIAEDDVIITPEQAKQIINSSLEITDFSQYENVYNIGDIHGCYEELLEIIPEFPKLDDRSAYVFYGDYCDRGPANDEVLKGLLKIKDKPNVVLLEGNHEKHLINYIKGREIRSAVTKEQTIPQLEAAKINKSTIDELIKKCKPYFCYTHNKKLVFCTHGGMSTIPKYPNRLATRQYINGCGKYEDMKKVNAWFFENTKSNEYGKECYQIHGHRNTFGATCQQNERCYCLVGDSLRACILSKDKIETYECKAQAKTEPNLLQRLRNNPNVNEKNFGNISSFNFSRKAFEKGLWDKETICARGLYLDIRTGKVVARGYEKFFAVDENEYTTKEAIKEKIEFPVQAYIKENGYLGIVSMYEGELFITTKSNPEANYAKRFRKMIEKSGCKNSIIEYLKNNNKSLVFEVIDPKNDPHIIEYKKAEFILLDIIDNTINFEKEKYDEVMSAARQIGVRAKKLAATLNNWEEFEKFFDEASKKDNKQIKNPKIEGYVFCGANNYMVKLKQYGYKYWKSLRGLSNHIIKTGSFEITQRMDEEMIKYCKWLLKKVRAGSELSESIIELRKKYYSER